MSLSETGLTILWRGSLASCNYGCTYCPFAKTKDDRRALAADQAALERFTEWVVSRAHPVSVLFTPWGEVLIRRYYRTAMVRLSHSANVGTVAIQTNLSCALGWVADADLETMAFWTTYHPGETERASFVEKINELHAAGARYSVGVVGLIAHLDEIERLREDLPDEAYLWVNAYKREPNYYSQRQLERLVAVDPFFELNNRSYASLGRLCRGGESVISVSADGTVRRCHFLDGPLGNIYQDDFERLLRPRPCSARTCRCHIGYCHLVDLDLPGLFGAGFLERRPAGPPERGQARARITAFEAKPSNR